MSKFIHLKGQVAVLQKEDELTRLGSRFGVRDAGAQIRTLLKDFSDSPKTPHVILPKDPTVGDFAVVLREYLFAGVPSRILIPIDHTGELTVLSAKEERVRTASRVLDYLLDTKMFVALLSLKNANGSMQATSAPQLSHFAVQTRSVRRSMLLGATLDDTLATLGARTRRNLRYYARKAEAEFAPVFEGDSHMSKAALLALNERGSHPFPEHVARRLHQLAQEPNSFLAALSVGDGTRYVSVIGGRRFRDQAIVDWQINDKESSKHSISTAMRYFYFKYEVERGTKLLSFEGGTPHSMQNSFAEESILDVLAVRRPLPPQLLRRCLKFALPQGNFISYILRAGEIIER